MTSKRESILAALSLRLAPLGGSFTRNGGVPARIPSGGLILLRDGDPGEPEVTLSPLTYHYEHRAEIEVLVQRKADLDAYFDDLCAAIGAEILADRTLGGLCDWVEPLAPAPVDLPAEDTVPVKAGVIPVVLTYSTTTPL